MNNTVLLVGLAAVAVGVGVAVAAKSAKDKSTVRVGLNPNDVRFRSPGLPPVPVRYYPGLGQVNFNQGT